MPLSNAIHNTLPKFLTQRILLNHNAEYQHESSLDASSGVLLHRLDAASPIAMQNSADAGHSELLLPGRQVRPWLRKHLFLISLRVLLPFFLAQELLRLFTSFLQDAVYTNQFVSASYNKHYVNSSQKITAKHWISLAESSKSVLFFGNLTFLGGTPPWGHVSQARPGSGTVRRLVLKPL